MLKTQKNLPRAAFAIMMLFAAFVLTGQGCQTTGETDSEKQRIEDQMLRDSYRQYRD